MSAEATFWAWEQKVSSTQKLTLLALANCHNESTGQCNPSVNYIVSRTGLNRKTVMNSLRELEEIGVIQSQKSLGSGSHYLLKTSTKIGTSTEIGTSTKNGTTTSTKNGTAPVPKLVPESKKNLKTESKNNTQAFWVHRITSEFPEVSEQVATDWLSARKQKRLAMTETAWEGTLREIRKTGLGVGEVLQIAAERGWGGFRASYLSGDEKQKAKQDDDIFRGAV